MRKQGDGVLVYFGYPRAHEDDAERAVRAGLRLIDAVGRLDIKSAKLQARVGIATGLMVVGDLIGEGSAQDQSVVGETPNLAAWPPPRDRAGDIDPNYRRSPKLARQNFRRSNRARQVCKDSPLEGDGFELPVPEREDRVSSLGLLLARDRGVGADVSVQPGFVIIMPSTSHGGVIRS